MKKFASLVFAVVLLAIMMTGFAVPAFADIAPGMIIRVYEGNEIIYADYDKSWDSIFSEMKTKCYSDWKGKTSLRCEIELNRDFTVDSLYYCDNLPMPITINLHGNTLEINYGDYWELDYSLTINGDGGTIKTTRSGDEYNCSIWVESGKLNVSGVTVENMKTNMKYPVFAMGNDCQDASFSNCTFNNCSSTNYGGAICMEETNNLDIISCTFNSCSAYYGGAVYLEDIVNKDSDGALYCKNSTFMSCSAHYGGAVYIYNNCAWDDDNERKVQRFYFQESVIKECSAEYDGGGIYMDCELGCLDLSYKDEISGCSADRYGGGVFLDGYESNVFGGQISSCEASYGGGVFCNDKDQSCSGVNIHDCTADEAGGAYYAEYNSGKYKIRLYNCTLNNNSPSNGNTASTLSEGNMTIICTVAAAVVFGFGGFFLGTKKKKPASHSEE